MPWSTPSRECPRPAWPIFQLSQTFAASRPRSARFWRRHGRLPSWLRPGKRTPCAIGRWASSFDLPSPFAGDRERPCWRHETDVLPTDDKAAALKASKPGPNFAGRHAAGDADLGRGGLGTLAEQHEDGGVGGGTRRGHGCRLGRWHCSRRKWVQMHEGRRIAPAASFRARHGAAMVEPRKSLAG